MADPVSWLQIEQGWNIVTSDGVLVGTVAQVEGDKQSDIFDGLAVESRQPTQIRYVPGEQVGAILRRASLKEIAPAHHSKPGERRTPVCPRLLAPTP